MEYINFIAFILMVIAYIRTSRLNDKYERVEKILNSLLEKSIKNEPPIAQEYGVVEASVLTVAREKISAKDTPTSSSFHIHKINKVKEPSRLTQWADKFFPWIQENWAGFLGMTILVLGITFGGIYVSVFATPFIRFCMVLGIASVFLALGIKLRFHQLWKELSAWSLAASGSIILFATIGSSYFESLKFYDNPDYGLYLTLAGTLFNVALAYYSSKQMMAALHVVMSLVGILVVPKESILFIVAVTVALGGIGLSYRQAWNYNIFITFISFLIFHDTWFNSQADIAAIAPLGIGGTLTVGLFALLVHYRKTYQQQSSTINLAIHLSIWMLLGYQLLWYNIGFKYIWLPLSIASLLSFALGQFAKRRNLTWLYLCDTLVGQFLAIFALFSLQKINFALYHTLWIAVLESLAFSAITYYSGQKLLSQIGAALTGAFLIMLLFFMFDGQVKANEIQTICFTLILPFYALRWFFATRAKSDTNNFLANFGDIYPKLLDIYTLVTATSLFYTFTYNAWHPYLGMLAALLVTAYNSTLMEDDWHKYCYVFLLIEALIYSIIHVLQINTDLVLTGIYILSPLCLLGTLLFTNFWRLIQAQKWVDDTGIYLLNLHIGIHSYYLLKNASTFLPGIVMLGLGACAFELGLFAENAIRNKERRQLLSAACKNVTIGYLLTFMVLYFTLYLQSEITIFEGFALKDLLILIAITLSLYWYFSRKQFRYPASSYTLRLANVTQIITFDIGLVLALALLVDHFSAPIHPIGYSLFALVLTLPYLKRMLPQRALVYAILLLLAACIQVAVVSSQWASPLSTWYQTTHITGPVALTLALMPATYLLTRLPERARSGWLGSFTSHPALAGFLPVFTAFAVFLFWRFDKSLLTMLWVIEVFLMVVIGYSLKQKSLVNSAYAFLCFCVGRLLIYDLAQSDLLIRAIVFVTIGLLMVLIHAMHKKFSGRLA